MSEVKQEVVMCSKCGGQELVLTGHLTEEGRTKFVCSTCRVRDQMPMEARLSEKQLDGKKILTEDL